MPQSPLHLRKPLNKRGALELYQQILAEETLGTSQTPGSRIDYANARSHAAIVSRPSHAQTNSIVPQSSLPVSWTIELYSVISANKAQLPW
jgi:hypothetical protein